MINSDSGNKFNISIGQVTGGDIQVGDRTYVTQPTPLTKFCFRDKLRVSAQ
jgi:hypothetical protein